MHHGTIAVGMTCLRVVTTHHQTLSQCVNMCGCHRTINYPKYYTFKKKWKLNTTPDTELVIQIWVFNETVHPKIKIWSLVTHRSKLLLTFFLQWNPKREFALHCQSFIYWEFILNYSFQSTRNIFYKINPYNLDTKYHVCGFDRFMWEKRWKFKLLFKTGLNVLSTNQLIDSRIES